MRSCLFREQSLYTRFWCLNLGLDWVVYVLLHWHCCWGTHTHLFNGFFLGLPRWAVFLCKSAPRSRQITMPAPHHSVFLQAGCPSCCPTNSVKALKATHCYWGNIAKKSLGEYFLCCTLYVPVAGTLNTHTHPFNCTLSGTTQVGRYQKDKTNLDFTEARDSEWQWHQLGHVQICTSLQK